MKLDIYRNNDMAVSSEQKDAKSSNGNKSFQPREGSIV